MPRTTLPIRQLPSGRWQARPAGFSPATFASYDDAETWCVARLDERNVERMEERGEHLCPHCHGTGLAQT